MQCDHAEKFSDNDFGMDVTGTTVGIIGTKWAKAKRSRTKVWRYGDKTFIRSSHTAECPRSYPVSLLTTLAFCRNGRHRNNDRSTLRRIRHAHTVPQPKQDVSAIYVCLDFVSSLQHVPSLTISGAQNTPSRFLASEFSISKYRKLGTALKIPLDVFWPKSFFTRMKRNLVLFFSRSKNPNFDVEFCSSLHDMLPVCDFVVISCPLTEETRNMIGPDQLDLMKPTSVLVNVGRGTFALCFQDWQKINHISRHLITLVAWGADPQVMLHPFL